MSLIQRQNLGKISVLLWLGTLKHSVALVDESRSPREAWKSVPFSKHTEGPTSATVPNNDYVVFSNIWFHNQRYYAVTERSSPQLPVINGRISRNTALVSLPIDNAAAFYNNIQGHWLSGCSILIDFAFPAYPDNLGFWLDVAIPIFCTLAASHWQEAAGNVPISSLIFTNINEENLEELGWVWELWKVVLSEAGLNKLPKILFWNDLDSVDKQHWLGIEKLLVATDRFMHPEGRAGFWTPELGVRFRELAFRAQGLEFPAKPPRTITFMGPVLGEQVANQLELIEYLQDVATSLDMRVRPYTVTSGAPFSSFLAAMARTGVLVSRHGPLLANAIFLPPGAVVVEMLPYHWEWAGSSMHYKNLTASVGDLHHVAWRARSAKHAYYFSDEDLRFAHWATEECLSPECLAIHAEAGMLADCPAVQELLYRVLPDVVEGKSRQEVEQPWPTVAPDISSSRLPWDT